MNTLVNIARGAIKPTIKPKPRPKPNPTLRDANLEKNRGFFVNAATGEIDFSKAKHQFFPGRKTILNDPGTMKTYRDYGIGRILANKQYPGLNFPAIGPLTQQQSKIYKDTINRAHPLMIDSRNKLPENMLPYVENPSFITTGYRNMGAHKFYENKINSYLDSKNSLVEGFKNKEMSKGKFLMDKSAIDAKIKNTTRDMRKLGLESMIYDKANNKFKYFGGLYDNMAKLYKNMGDDYFLQNPSSINPVEVSPAFFKKLMGFPKPTTKTALNKKGEFVEKDAKDAIKIGEGQWWSDRGRDNFGGYWRTKEPFFKNRGSGMNLDQGGLVSMLGRNDIQKMAKLLSSQQLNMLRRK